jgi:hypothetical protein
MLVVALEQWFTKNQWSFRVVFITQSWLAQAEFH